MLVPQPTTARIGGTPLRDRELLAWANEIVDTVLLDGAPDGAAATSAQVT